VLNMYRTSIHTPNETILKEAVRKVEALDTKVELNGSEFMMEDPSGNRIKLRVK